MSNSNKVSIDVLRRRLLAASSAGVGGAGLKDLLGSLTLALMAITDTAAQTGSDSLVANTPETSRIFEGRKHLAGFVYCQMIERIFDFWKLNKLCIDKILCSKMSKKDIEDSVDRFCDSNKYNENLITYLHKLLVDEYNNQIEYGRQFDSSDPSHKLKDEIEKFVDDTVVNTIGSNVYPDQCMTA